MLCSGFEDDMSRKLPPSDEGSVSDLFGADTWPNGEGKIEFVANPTISRCDQISREYGLDLSWKGRNNLYRVVDLGINDESRQAPIPENPALYNKELLEYSGFPSSSQEIRILKLHWQRKISSDQFGFSQAAAIRRNLTERGFQVSYNGKTIITGFTLPTEKQKFAAKARKDFIKGQHCVFCGKSDPSDLEVDHRTPMLRHRTEGSADPELQPGGQTPHNVEHFQVLCSRCNLRKSRVCERCVRSGEIRCLLSELIRPFYKSSYKEDTKGCVGCGNHDQRRPKPEYEGIVRSISQSHPVK